ncbi:MAG: PilW family protein, partial [Cyanobium sp.]
MAVLFRASSVESRSGGGSGRPVRAFTLVELLLVLCMGLALSAVLVQLLVAESRLGAVMVRQWRERTLQRRTLDLVRDDLRRAGAIRLGTAGSSPCPHSARAPVLGLSPAVGPIESRLGRAP